MTNKNEETKSATEEILLSRREKISYGIGDIANGIAVSSVAFWLLFYLTNIAGLPGTYAGIALMIGRIWDAVTDPLVGWLSDRTRSRWGKRRPYLLFGAWTYGLAFLALWIVPEFESELSTFLYILIAFILFNTALTFVFIPYTSLTAAMTDDYQERVSLTGYRMTCSQAAFLLGGALPPFLVGTFALEVGSGYQLFEALGMNSLFGTWAGTDRQGYFIMGLIFAAIIVCSTLICFCGTRERLSSTNSKVDVVNPISYLTGLVSISRTNVAFRSAVLIKLLSTCATTVIGVNIPFYLTYVLSMPDQKTWVLGTLFLSAIIATPAWVIATRRFGKAETFRFAMCGYIIVLALLVPLPSEPTLLIYPLVVFAGLFHSAALMIPWSIIPDVVEYDELSHGSRREGLLYGGAAFAYKFASAFAIFVVGVLLDAFGYIPNQAQSETARLGLELSITLVPMLLLAVSIWASMNYPLTSTRYREVLAKLKERRLSR